MENNASIPTASDAKEAIFVSEIDDNQPKRIVESPGDIIEDWKDKKQVVLEQIFDEQTGETGFLIQTQNQVLHDCKLIARYETSNLKILLPMENYPFPRLGTPNFQGNYDSVDMKGIYDEVVSFVKAHLYLKTESSYCVIASYIIATWIYEKFASFPYLFFLGDLATGKSRALEVIRVLCHRGFLTSNTTPAVIYRMGEDWKPTLLYDETDNIDSDVKTAILSIANSGYRKDSYVTRMGDGGQKILCYNAYFPKVFAGTKSLADTLESRCIMIRMVEKPEELALNRTIDDIAAHTLRKKLLAYRLFHITQKIELPDVPVRRPRTKEIFTPIFYVTPAEYRDFIKEIANKTESNFDNTRSNSVASMLIEAILRSCHKAIEENDKLYLKTITENLNNNSNGQGYSRKFRGQDVTKILREVGFDGKTDNHANDGNYIRWDESFDLWLQQMIKQYIKDDDYRSELEKQYFGDGRQTMLRQAKALKEFNQYRERRRSEA